MRHTRKFSGAVVLVLILGAIGCGGSSDLPDLATVQGTVTLDDKPLANAGVDFMPVAGGRPSTGITDDDGYYELEYSPGNPGVAPGEHLIVIRTATTIDKDGESVNVPETVPAEYNDDTELKRTVEKGSNEIDFPLKSGGKINQPDDGGDDSGLDDC